MKQTDDIHTLLNKLRNGGDVGSVEMWPKIQDQLKRIARSRLKREVRGHVLQTTVLADDALVKLTHYENLAINDLSHFFALASIVMDHELANYRRSRRAARRNFGLLPTHLTDSHAGQLEDIQSQQPDEQLHDEESRIKLDEALAEVGQILGESVRQTLLLRWGVRAQRRRNRRVLADLSLDGLSASTYRAWLLVQVVKRRRGRLR